MAAPFVWLGMVLAISFVETPLKFQAPGITLPLGLQIGRLVFPALNVLELAFGLALTVLLWRRRATGRLVWRLLAGVWVVLLVQVFLLRPVLDDRAARIIAGHPVPGAPWHLVYIGLECLKVLALVALGSAAVRVAIRDATRPRPVKVPRSAA